MTRQLLIFAKGGAPVKETSSLQKIIKESCLFALHGSKSECEFFLEKDLWSAEVDVGQINQVFDNIIINANRAMPEGGNIKISARNGNIHKRDLLPLKPGKYIGISFEDKGVGISKNHLEKIFDPYFTTKQAGSGLGLATTYSIIKKHEGHITVKSRIGKGTTFQIYLPASEKVLSEKKEMDIKTGHGRILVMDDEMSLRKMLEMILEKLGYESEIAKDGAEAIRMYKESIETEKPYDAVILDLTIPGGIGGKEAIQKLLEIDPEIKAIVSSGYSDDSVLAKFQEFGFKGILPKPFDIRTLSATLYEVINVEKK